MIDSVIEWRDGDKPGAWREDQGKRKALQPGVARERDPFAVGTLREAAVDASVLARVARRVRAEALELAVESLRVPAVLERERGALLGDGAGGDQASEGDGKEDNAGETHDVVNGRESGRKDRARIAKGDD